MYVGGSSLSQSQPCLMLLFYGKMNPPRKEGAKRRESPEEDVLERKSPLKPQMFMPCLIKCLKEREENMS